MLDKAFAESYNKAHQRSSGIDHRQVRREFPLLFIIIEVCFWVKGGAYVFLYDFTCGYLRNGCLDGL